MADFRILRPDNARELAMLHASAFASPWSPAALRSELAKPSVFGLALLLPKDRDSIVSFVLFQRALGEAEMLTLATESEAQGNGFAHILLKTAFKHLTERGIARCILDVAADNMAAISLYQKLGFVEDGRRKEYYKRADGNRVDSLLMSSDLTGL